MFVYSLKASTLKFFGVIGVLLVTVVALLIFVPSYSSKTTTDIEAMNESISFKNVKNAEDVSEFLSQFGWEVEDAPVEECEITIPKEFDKVLSTYNELQKQQGLDLSKYCRKTALRVTYKITNYPSYNGTVWANVIIYKDKVIAGDICSADAKGFIHTLHMPSDTDN